MHSAALWAQRQAHRVPAPVRALGRRILGGLGSGDVPDPLEDWSVPLIAGRGSVDLLTLRPAPVSAGPAPVSAGSAPVSVPVSAGPTPGEPSGTPPPTMRAVIAIDTLDAGGMDEFAAFLGRRLPGQGIETVVAYAGTHIAGQEGKAGGRLVETLAKEGVPTVALTAGSCRDWLRSYRPDVVSAHGAPAWLLAAVQDLQVPWVETLHGMHHFLDPASWGPERERARGIAAQITVSESVRRQYLAGNPEFPADRIVTVPNGVDDERVRLIDRAAAREALGLRDEFLFLSLARYGLQKNTYALVSAFAEVAASRPDVHLLIAGRADDTRYYEQVYRLARGLDVADRIHLRGHCGNPAALLAAADAFVLDSFFEGWPLASMEASAAGVPLLLSDVGGAREQLAGGTRGYLIENPAGSPGSLDWRTISDLRFRTQANRGELIAALGRLADDRADWAGRRDAVRADALATFSAAECLRRHAAVLRAVASGEPLPAF